MLKLLKFSKKSRKYLLIQSLFAWLPRLSFAYLLFILLIQGKEAVLHWHIFGLLFLIQLLFFGVFKKKIINKYAYEAKKELRQLYLEAFYKQDKEVDKAAVLQKELKGLDSLDTFYHIFFPSLIQFIWGYLGLIIVSLYFKTWIWLLPVFFILMMGLTMMVLNKMGKSRNSKFIESFTALGRRFLNDLSGMNTLIMYSVDKDYQETFEEESEFYRKKTMDVLFYQLQSLFVLHFFLYLTIVIAVFLLYSGIAGMQFSFEIAVALFFYFVQFMVMASAIGYFFHIYFSSKPSIDRILGLIEEQRNAERLPEAELGEVKSLEIVDLELGYKNRPLIEGLNLKLEAGRPYALVGYNGSGKSTLASNIMAWKKPMKGEIRANGVDVLSIDNASWLKHIGYLGSNSYLFDGSIADNLMMSGCENWREKLDELGLCKFVSTLEQGFDTKVGENGRLLSYGQRQQIAFARLLLAGKDVFIFDEVASNLDAANRRIIMDEIQKLGKEKLVIVISHHWEEIARIGNILWINNKTVTFGEHDELLKTNSDYVTLAEGGKDND